MILKVQRIVRSHIRDILSSHEPSMKSCVRSRPIIKKRETYAYAKYSTRHCNHNSTVIRTLYSSYRNHLKVLINFRNPIQSDDSIKQIRKCLLSESSRVTLRGKPRFDPKFLHVQTSQESREKFPCSRDQLSRSRVWTLPMTVRVDIVISYTLQSAIIINVLRGGQGGTQRFRADLKGHAQYCRIEDMHIACS